jgi:integrase
VLPPAPRSASTSSAMPAPPSFNSGVSIEVVRRRLGHASTETTQIYTLLADKVADTEIRAARRKREMRRR